MPFEYVPPSSGGALRQGEIIGPVWEHRPNIPPTEQLEQGPVPVGSFHHQRVVVLSPDCDLHWDFAARFTTADDGSTLVQDEIEVEEGRHGIPHVLTCDAYEKSAIHDRVGQSDIWRRVKQNQDERYHKLPEAPFADARDEAGEAPPALPDLFLDFKKALALPTALLYQGVQAGAIERVAIVPPIYLHDLIHRFYTFLSRVAVPV